MKRKQGSDALDEPTPSAKPPKRTPKLKPTLTPANTSKSYMRGLVRISELTADSPTPFVKPGHSFPLPSPSTGTGPKK